MRLKMRSRTVFTLMILFIQRVISTNDTIGDRFWAHIDGTMAMLHYSRLKFIVYDSVDEFVDGRLQTVMYSQDPVWTVMQYGQVNPNRKQSSMVVSRLASPKFPLDIFDHFYLLRDFKLCNQDVEEISDAHFVNAYVLVNLNLSGNAIKTLPRDSVDTVFLQNNKISQWNTNNYPRYFYNLNISNNPLDKKADVIFLPANNFHSKNSNITSIIITKHMLSVDASENSIIKIFLFKPGDDDVMVDTEEYKLVRCYLSKNLLTDSSVTAVGHFVNLEILNLSSNLIESLDAVIFSKLNKLRERFLGGNLLKQTSLAFVCEVKNLELLDLSFNQLDEFHLTNFSNSLIEIRLQGNNLAALDTNVKNQAPKLQRLGINDNNWDCHYLIGVFESRKLEGVSVAVNDSAAPFRHYEDNVRGVGCYLEKGSNGDV